MNKKNNRRVVVVVVVAVGLVARLDRLHAPGQEGNRGAHLPNFGRSCQTGRIPSAHERRTTQRHHQKVSQIPRQKNQTFK